MNRLVNEKTVKIMSFVLSGAFLMVHVIMFLLFYYCHVTPMIYFNICSMVFYAGLMLVVSRKGLFRSYALLMYLEVVLHMSMAVYFTGWDSGFQNTLIGMSVIFFYFEFMAKCLRLPYIRALPFCCGGMLDYLALCAVSYHSAPKYPLPEEVTFWLQIFWGVVVFIFTIGILFVFCLLSAGSYVYLSGRAKKDQLTELPNRYYVSDYLKELEQGVGFADHWIALIDIDDFKKVNDTYGHNCGDVVLKEVASLLQESLIGDLVSRWGGEEFIIIGRETDQLENKLNRMRKTIENHTFIFEEVKLHITVTIGVAYYQLNEEVRQWIGEADERMYQGKQNGKNQVVIC